MECFHLYLTYHPASMVGTDTRVADDKCEGLNPPYRIPGINTYSCYPLLYQKYVKESEILTIEEAVQKTSTMACRVFNIKGRGVVATGRIERGLVHVGDKVELVGIKDEISVTTVTGVEMFNKTLPEGQAGDNVGCLLRGVEYSAKNREIERGMVLAAPKTITPHTKFEGEVYVLTKEEGGRHTPFFSGYRPQFFFRTTDVTGSLNLLGGAEMCMPGDNVTMKVELGKSVAMEQGLRFAVREGGRTVGSGVVAKVLE